MFEALRPGMLLSQGLGGPTLESYLLARHKALDRLLQGWLEEEGEVQVLEVAAGLSPRGWRFCERYGEPITYVEGDLPDMAARKRRALERMGSLGDRHRMEQLDALRPEGPTSLATVAAGLKPELPLAIVTEGLLSYLERRQLLDLWRRFADTLSGFRRGRYLSDLHLSEDGRGPLVEAFRALLSAFVRGPVSIHFAGEEDAVAALRTAGFAKASVSRLEARPVRIVDAEV
jgi:O-methyltransferase involved in polyketide biosynthesis